MTNVQLGWGGWACLELTELLASRDCKVRTNYQVNLNEQEQFGREMSLQSQSP